MQKARRHPDKSGLRPLVGAWFQGLFTPLLRVLFTFPLRYWFAIGLPVVFRLSGWCRQVQTGFLQPRPTQDTAKWPISFAYGAITRCGRLFQVFLLKISLLRRSPTTPVSTLTGLASSAFARHYSRNHFCFLFLRLLRCFSSAGLRLCRYVFNISGFPIRTPADQGSFAPPRRFSQLTASFVASGSQGIHHAPLFRFHLFPFLTVKLSTGSFFESLLFWLLFYWLDYSLYFFASLFLPVLSMNFLSPFPRFQERLRLMNSPNTRGRAQRPHKLDSNQSRSLWSSAPANRADVVVYSFISPLPLAPLFFLVEDQGFEPRTPCVQGRCSSQLS